LITIKNIFGQVFVETAPALNSGLNFLQESGQFQKFDNALVTHHLGAEPKWSEKRLKLLARGKRASWAQI